MIRSTQTLVCWIGMALGTCAAMIAAAEPPPARQGPQVPATLPQAGQVVTDFQRSEVLLHAVVQKPVGKPCIDAYGQRVQAFAGCSRADGHPASMAAYFVFLVDAPTEDVANAMVRLGARPRISYSMAQGHQRSGLDKATKPENYLQGDPVTVSVLWKDPKTGWVEKSYQDFCTEQMQVDGVTIDKPWTPSFVYHGSGAIFHSGTGCIACPCDCAGGLIADNRFPLYDPKPTVRFNTAEAPPPGTSVYIRLRPVCSGRPTTQPVTGELLGDAIIPTSATVMQRAR